MNNIHLSILGSAPFSNILNELEFNNVLNQNNISNHSDKKILVKILFVEHLKIKEVKKYLLMNEPIILFLNSKDFIKKNNLKELSMGMSNDYECAINYGSTFVRVGSKIFSKV